MKKVVLKLDLHDDKDKKKAMKAVSCLTGVDSITVDLKDQKLTVIGDIDPVNIVSKLRKLYTTDILTVGPAKEPEKKKEEPKKQEDQKKKDPKPEVNVPVLWNGYPPYLYPPNYHYPHLNPPYYMEEEPSRGCVIS